MPTEKSSSHRTIIGVIHTMTARRNRRNCQKYQSSKQPLVCVRNPHGTCVPLHQEALDELGSEGFMDTRITAKVWAIASTSGFNPGLTSLSRLSMPFPCAASDLVRERSILCLFVLACEDS